MKPLRAYFQYTVITVDNTVIAFRAKAAVVVIVAKLSDSTFILCSMCLHFSIDSRAIIWVLKKNKKTRVSLSV